MEKVLVKQTMIARIDVMRIPILFKGQEEA